MLLNEKKMNEKQKLTICFQESQEAITKKKEKGTLIMFLNEKAVSREKKLLLISIHH